MMDHSTRIAFIIKDIDRLKIAVFASDGIVTKLQHTLIGERYKWILLLV